ncbi:MAG: cupin domain-containing protein [Alphaproteobacteria bacterium]
MDSTLNTDFSQRVLMNVNEMEWLASPSRTVWRKRFDLMNGEHGRVTSVVRYDADSSFPAHDHPDGEEILVLDGVFSDEHGDYPAGTYLLNPPGFRHAPFSRGGCVLFVKLYQYGGQGREHFSIDTNALEWQPGRADGVSFKPLYQHPEHPETVALFRIAAGTRVPLHDHPGGEEAYVIDGGIEDEHGACPAGTWLRLPPGSSHAPFSAEGCTLYVKTGHLAEMVE